jgi:hypothetical protein
MPKNPHRRRRISRSPRSCSARIIAAMETLSDDLSDTDRARRIGRVVFMTLPEEPGASGPALRDDPPAAGPQAAAGPFRLLQLLRRIASRVEGRPSAARP